MFPLPVPRKLDRGKATRNLYRLLARYSGIIFVLPSCLLIGIYLGRFLDYFLGTYPWLTMVFFFVGAAAGFVQVFRFLTRKQ